MGEVAASSSPTAGGCCIEVAGSSVSLTHGGVKLERMRNASWPKLIYIYSAHCQRWNAMELLPDLGKSVVLVCTRASRDVHIVEYGISSVQWPTSIGLS